MHRAPRSQGQDCCCEVYMAAAEMYLTAIKLLERDSKDGDGDGEARRLKARVAKLLDRVELKKTGRRPQPEALPPPPVSSSLTATCGLDDLPLPPTTLPPMAPAPTVVQAPASGSDESRPPKLTSVEIEVLKRSSVINGRVFLPWLDGEELLEDFTCGEAAPFSDPDGLFHLSPQQAARLGGWKRPSQFVGPDHQPPRIIKAISPFR